MPNYVKKMRQREGEDAFLQGRQTERYRVYGPTTQIEALNAVDADTGTAVPRRGDPHDEDPEFIVFDRLAVWQDYSQEYSDIWVVEIVYRKPQWEFTTDGLEWFWEGALISTPSSVDAYGRALVNSASQPLVGSYDKATFVQNLHVWVNGVYSPALAKAVTSRVNSTSMTLFPGTSDAFGIDAGNMICRIVEPVQSQRSPGVTQRLHMLFSIQDGLYPWFLHAPDQSYAGYYSSSGSTVPGNFTNSNGSEVSSPVLLDGGGGPLTGGYTVEGKPAVSTIAPSWVQFELTDAGTYEAIFETEKNYDFTGFIPGVM